MNYFVLRPFQNGQEIQIKDDTTLFKVPLSVFNEIEPEFDLDVDVRQIEYQPGLLHQVIKYNGTYENLPLDFEEYDTYISKISVYEGLKAELDQEAAEALLPQTLVEAKTLANNNIKTYASNLLSLVLNQPNYKLESYRWQSVILPEANLYISTEDPVDAPNLVAQRLVELDNPSADINAAPFKAAILAKSQDIVDEDTLITNSINHYVGMQNRWLQVVSDFEQSIMETEKQAIIRLLAIDYTVGWELS